MLHSGLGSKLSIASTALLAATLTLSGCGHSHPNDRMAVYDSLNKNDLRSVNVTQDQDSGTMTLTGIVGSSDRKQKAEQLAKQAAPDYSIVDRIQVANTGLQKAVQAAQRDVKIDHSIEDHYKATLRHHSALSHVSYSAYNQTLTLKGKVKTYKDREEAEDLAKKVPNVEKVVNEIELENGNKPSSSNAG
jgi:hyperosmotically inducible protein